MAFAKKTAKAPANYAREKAKAEEVEEVIDEVEEGEGEEAEDVQDDYDSAEPDAPPAPRQAAFPRRSPAPRQSSQREPGKALRLTGLFAGKRDGCFSGKLRDEDASNLAALIQEAQSTNQQVVFFLWENQSGPQFSLTANISAPVQKKSWGNKGGGGGQGWNRGGQGGNGGNFNRGFRRY